MKGTIAESEEWLASGRPGPHHLRNACDTVGSPGWISEPRSQGDSDRTTPEAGAQNDTPESAMAAFVNAQNRRSVRLAMDSDHVGTEHVVLGILRHETGPASSLLRSMDITREVFLAQLYKEGGHAPSGPIPLIPRAHEIVGLAGTFTAGLLGASTC